MTRLFYIYWILLSFCLPLKSWALESPNDRCALKGAKKQSQMGTNKNSGSCAQEEHSLRKIQKKAEAFMKEAQSDLQKFFSEEQVKKVTGHLQKLLKENELEKGIQSAQKELQRILSAETLKKSLEKKDPPNPKP